VIVFVDTSALLSRYVEEQDRSPLPADATVAISQLTRVEVPSALWGKQRAGQLSAEAARDLTSAFETDYYGANDAEPGFFAVDVTPAVLDNAARLVATHSLRAYDAVQLATGLAIRDEEPECSTFATYDEVLRRAASAEGFRLLP
jgi:uncharacterized protein